jgi:hypothetical protein
MILPLPTVAAALVSIPGFHFVPMETSVPTSTVLSTSTSVPTSSTSCLKVTATNYLTDGYSVEITKDDRPECWIKHGSNQAFTPDGPFSSLDMKCSKDNVKATLQVGGEKGGWLDELSVGYVGEDGNEVFIEVRPTKKNDWVVEDGTVCEKYTGSLGC